MQVTQLDLEEFCGVVGAQHVLSAPSDVEPYNVDWLKNHRYDTRKRDIANLVTAIICSGQSTVVIRPRTTEEVSKIMSHCSKQR